MTEVGADIILENGILRFVPTVGVAYMNQTKGLLGNFNKDGTDDFISPDGTHYPDTLTEREIYEYGQKCKRKSSL